VLACLAKSPDDRPQTASALRQKLASCADNATWTEDSRRRWWESHADSLREQPTKISDAATLAVDLGQGR
ncbi:unnamed protein product, partial [marine sediment metagenome]